ncbi:MAG: DUF4926 domain-containing protein [Myxococcota bacterium]
MSFKTLEMIVLEHDLPEYALLRGDLGTVVHVYEKGGLEVEFVTAGGRTEAVVTLRETDVRPAGDSDLVSVRPARRSA